MRWNLPPSSNRIFENRAGAMDETPEDRIRELEAENARLRDSVSILEETTISLRMAREDDAQEIARLRETFIEEACKAADEIE